MSYDKLKCVKCGSINDLKPFKFSSSKTSFILSKILPVCNSCYEKFKKREHISKILACFIFLSLFIMAIGPIGGFIAQDLYIGINYVIAGWILLLITTTPLFYLLRKNSDNKPLKYVKLDFGTIQIKSELAEGWINYQTWAKMVIEERILNGTLTKTGDPRIPLEDPRKRELDKTKPPIEIKNLQNMKKEVGMCPNCGNLLFNQEKCVICNNKENI